MNKKLAVFLTLFLLTYETTGLAAAKNKFEKLTQFKLQPLVEAQLASGSQNLLGVQGLIPIFGNENHVFYSDLEGKITKNDSSWTLGFGGGYRQIINDRIYGSYLMIDASKSPARHRFWNANLGLETLGNTWDLRANAYLPIGKNSWEDNYTITGFASDFGDWSRVSYNVNSKYDAIVSATANFKEANSRLAGDFEVGHVIPLIKNLWGYVGGYYFTTTDLGNVRGMSARINYKASDHLAFEAVNTYDNHRHNTTMLGIKVSFGGFSNKEKDEFGISGRLLDPIQHNIATIANGYAVPIRTETKQTFTNLGKIALVGDNYVFVKPGALPNGAISSGSGTFEDPYIASGIDADLISKAGSITHTTPGINLNFLSGSYLIQGYANNRAPLLSGYNIYGFSDVDATYRTPANGDKRALFYGGFELQGNNSLNNIRLLNTDITDTDPAIILDNNVDNIMLNGMQIGVDDTDRGASQTAEDYAVSIGYLAGAGSVKNLTVKNSSIYAYQNASSANDVIGISALHIDKLIVDNSIIHAVCNTPTGSNFFNGAVFGILIGYDSFVPAGIQDVTVSNNIVTLKNGSDISATVEDGNAYGVLIGTNSVDESFSDSTSTINLNVNNNKVNIESGSKIASETANSGTAYGVLIGNNMLTLTSKGNIVNNINDNSISISDSPYAINSTASSLTASDYDAYGAMIGNREFVVYTTQDIQNTINRNKITITNSDFAVDTNVNIDTGVSFSSGLLIGNAGSFSPTSTDITQGTGTININNNIITINNSDNAVTSDLNFASGGNDIAATYGILIGNGMLDMDTTTSASINTSNNAISINNSSTAVRARAILDGGSSANAFGVLIGNYSVSDTKASIGTNYNTISLYNSADAVTSMAVDGGHAYGVAIGSGSSQAGTFTTDNNIITIDNSGVTASGDNAIGVLLGISPYSIYSTAQISVISNNQIAIENNSSLDVIGKVSAYGISVDNSKDEIAGKVSGSGNKLSFGKTSTITVDPNGGTAYGIWASNQIGFSTFSIRGNITGGVAGSGVKIHRNGQDIAW